MNKTILAVLVVGLSMVCAVGTAGATSFTSTTDVDRWVIGNGTLTWAQAMPSDFEMPYDTINSATLKIYSNFVDGNNDMVSVENTFVGNLKNDTGWFLIWNPLESRSFDIASAITAPWSTGQSLDISLAYDERGLFNCLLYVDESILCLDYNNGASPVPEPGTVLLLGIGMAGIAICGKRRLNNNA
ncbi:PEP-CTERM sorting domain-containing protein [Geomonas subterranea]|uniref:PEP-CTERM sorting domain-containing protein n=1 Tax=Geomonas subterranea TaxID=2847989 RepID=A0ABX8LKS8_9BACT|nr:MULTISPECIES: PEP-CTERM sorting domain-containing protein [Geomonas]QXE92628.1 PEP-CTERM sorting domain-containing protein [Geomonas subterranea]QXM09273.1 PEP-CTERM sorting domain-containing protein [Geomonas subterranea]